METKRNNIYFVTSDKELRDMAYGDTIYAWLLLNSHYDPEEKHNYIYKKDFTYEIIGKDIGKTRQSVSKRFKKLLELNEEESRKGRTNLIVEFNKYYVLPNFKDFQKLDSDTVINLLRLCEKSRREELIKTYAWLLKKWEKEETTDISLKDLIMAFGHSHGNEQMYNHYKDILTTLQGAGLIKFKTGTTKSINGWFAKTITIYQVNRKANIDWLDKKKA